MLLGLVRGIFDLVGFFLTLILGMIQFVLGMVIAVLAGIGLVTVIGGGLVAWSLADPQSAKEGVHWALETVDQHRGSINSLAETVGRQVPPGLVALLPRRSGLFTGQADQAPAPPDASETTVPGDGRGWVPVPVTAPRKP